MNNVYYENEDSEESESNNIINTFPNSYSQLSNENNYNTQVSNENNVDYNTMDIKKLVYECINCETELKELDKKKKEINNKLKQIKICLIPFMENNEIDFIKIKKNKKKNFYIYIKKIFIKFI